MESLRSDWVTVVVPATSANLGPGFDTLGLALDWCEEVSCRLVRSGLRVHVEGPGGDRVPADATNLAVRGAEAVLEMLGRRDLGLDVRLRVRLPVGRGLGSSAAAVVGGAVAANALLGEPLSGTTLLELASGIEGHPDNVAPALLGGFCVAAPATGTDPGIWALRLPPPPGLSAVAAIPDRLLPTSEARNVLPATVAFRDAVSNVQRTALWVAAVASGHLEAIGDATADWLHQPYRQRLLPGLATCLDAARGAGALGCFLSGAGPTVLALVRDGGDGGDRVAKAMAGALPAMGGGRIRHLALRPDGARWSWGLPPGL